MKLSKRIRLLCGWMLLALCCLFTACAGALTFEAQLVSGGRPCPVLSVEKEEGQYLLLPAFADLSKLVITADEAADGLVWQNEAGETVAFESGKAVNWPAVSDETEEGGYAALLTDASTGEEVTTLHVMKSENLRAMFLFSADPAQDRVWLEDCLKHEKITSANMMLVDTNGHLDTGMHVEEIRGRGNGTWDAPKHAYQMKMDKKVDLLKTGIGTEKNKIWILLANAYDPTLLRNRFVMDMALELGMTETSMSESIDLYYDGEYRGNYLLCEKVEVKPGRIEIEEADDILALMNGPVTDHLPVGQDVNRFGVPYTYLEGFRDGGYLKGSYMLELEYVGNTLSERCFFTLKDNTTWGLRSPDGASRRMMELISENTQEAWNTLMNMGVDPETGKRFEDYFDMETFVLPVLLGEALYNEDAFAYSSTFLIKETNSHLLRCGPVWDYDLSCSYRLGKDGTEVTAYKKGDLTREFLSVPSFRKLCRKYYIETLYPTIQNMLHGTKDGRYLKTLDHYVEQIAASQRMNEVIWGVSTHKTLICDETFEECIDTTRDFLDTRSNWLKDEAESWQFDNADDNYFTMTTYYGREIADAKIEANVGTNARIRKMDISHEWLEDDELDLYVLNLIIDPVEGFSFTEDTCITINYSDLPFELMEDGSIELECCFTVGLEEEVLYGGDNYHWFEPYITENDW